MNNKKITLCCQPEHVRMRLDKFLFINFSDYSRSYFHTLIEDKLITVNNILIQKPSYTLKEGDVVTVTFPPQKMYDLTPQQVEFDVIDIQEDFIVINKPAGLVVHAGQSNKDEISLVNGLLYRFSELNSLVTTADGFRPGIVHRIDRDTSGLLLVARTHKGHIALNKMFHDRSINKTYITIVHGHPSKEGQITLSIGRDPKERHKMASAGIGNRQAITNYKSIAYYPLHTLVAANIITGRTHQIRVHFSAIGHSVVGDQTYGKKTHLINRQALHAWQLTFTYQGKQYCYRQHIPEDIKQLIKSIK
jgi:23S rRNA pseudouridine1911/1915/1917 synthase